MAAGVTDDDPDVHAEISAGSSAGGRDASTCTSSGGSEPEQGRWEVRIHIGEHQISRTASYQTAPGGVKPETGEAEVIWPTWPATIEDEAEVTTSPLADLQRYWSTSGNRLRESAKWMALEQPWPR